MADAPVHEAPGPSQAAAPSFLPDREAWLAVLVALVAGLALIVWIFGRRGVGLRSSNAASSTPTSATSLSFDTDDQSLRRRRERVRGFALAQISAAPHVLFVADAETDAAPFVELFGALDVALDVIDLSRVAGGRQIVNELRNWRRNEVEEGEPTDVDGHDEQHAFLFINSRLVGDFSRVKRQLLARELEAAIPTGQWARVRLDSRSDRGFDVRSPTNTFQSLVDVATEQDPSSRLEVKPLRSLAELQDVDLSPITSCAVPLAARSRDQARRSKLLVCHDMKGGYLQDRFRQGSDEFDAYRFYQWDLVDTFIYFSHALVTIPPVGWVLASHRHGTRALGTFITEGDAGRELVAELFADSRYAEMYAAKLVAIAWRGGFDGWLVNLENTIPSALVPNVQTFLRVLRRGLQANNPDAQVIWYGCLTKEGKRKHQVRLDESSTDFFQHVDGFFTDYGWTADDAKFSAAFDLDRRYDICMGVDVFGRHDTVGGGKLNCDKLLRLAWNSGVSAVVFAPGWTYECYQHEAQLPFVAAEDSFWQRLRACWKPRSPCFDALGGVNCFYSAFNSGRGRGMWVDGQRVSSSEWSNMSEMDIQPASALHYGVHIATSAGQLTASVTNSIAFHGGSSVMLEGKLGGREKKYFKLFNVDIVFTARRIMEINYVSAAADSSTCLLVLTVCPGVDHATHQIILSSGSTTSSGHQASSADATLSPVLGLRPGRHFLAPVSTETFDGPTPTGWVRKTYRLGGQLWDEKHLVEVGVLCTAAAAARQPSDRHGHTPSIEYEAYLGEVCVVGCEKGVPRPVPRSARDEPRLCVNARVTSVVRLGETQGAALGVEWELSADGEPVRYVLLHLCSFSGQGRSPPRRTFLGKSFDQFFWVERCPLRRSVGEEDSSDSVAPPIVAIVELQSVSWAGQLASTVCRLHLEE